MQIIWACVPLAFLLFQNTACIDEESVTTETQKNQQCHGECKVTLGKKQTHLSNMKPYIEKSEIALLLLLGFSGFSLVVAAAHRNLRKYVFKDVHSLDTVFDAGGRVSLSLTAVTVTSQVLWPIDFLETSILISKSGLGGSLWYGVAVVSAILCFPAISLYLKTRAPGAKTFPQIAYARFGKGTHIMFCIIALSTNLSVSCTIMLAGKALIETLSKNCNNEFIYAIIAVLFGSYCLVGGLGTTFYISYFNTALTFLSVTVYTLYTSFYPPDNVGEISSIDTYYDYVQHLQAPDGNYGNSYLTFRTKPGLIYGIVVMFLTLSVSFCDQANWQSRIAAKPSQGVIGFIFAAFMWFTIPTTLSFTASLTYFAMSAKNGTHLLSEEEINSGYILPFVMTTLLGNTGAYLLLTMLVMSLMATGSGEVMAISSIIIYDIYKTHINPFRKGISNTACVLCGKEKIANLQRNKKTPELCICPTAIDCVACEEDAKVQSIVKHFAIHYKCKYHGELRHYEDGLMRYKSWCMIWVVIGLVPFGLIVSESGIDFNWATLAIPVFLSSSLWPMLLTMSWSKVTGPGIITGGTLGLICSIALMLIIGSTYDGGLDNFFVNTTQDYSLLFSMIGGFVVSGIVCIGVSLCTHKIRTKEDSEREWEKTINIDNPLHPFRLVYKEELEEIGAGPIITSATMGRVFIKAKRVALFGAGLSLTLFLIVIPSTALSYTVLTQEQLTAWLRTLQWWCFIGTVLVVVVPPVEEGILIWRKYQDNKQKTDNYDSDIVRLNSEKL